LLTKLGEMEKLVVMDYSSGQVHIYFVNKGLKIDDEFVCNLGFNLDEIYWMHGKCELVYHDERILDESDKQK